MIMHKASEIAEKVNRNKTVNIEANAAGRMYSVPSASRVKIISRNERKNEEDVQQGLINSIIEEKHKIRQLPAIEEVPEEFNIG